MENAGSVNVSVILLFFVHLFVFSGIYDCFTASTDDRFRISLAIMYVKLISKEIICALTASEHWKATEKIFWYSCYVSVMHDWMAFSFTKKLPINSSWDSFWDFADDTKLPLLLGTALFQRPLNRPHSNTPWFNITVSFRSSYCTSKPWTALCLCLW